MLTFTAIFVNSMRWGRSITQKETFKGKVNAHRPSRKGCSAVRPHRQVLHRPCRLDDASARHFGTSVATADGATCSGLWSFPSADHPASSSGLAAGEYREAARVSAVQGNRVLP